MVKVEIEVPEPVYKWLNRVAKIHDCTLEKEILSILVDDLRAWIDSDASKPIIFSQAIEDGLHKVFKEYDNMPSDPNFKEMVEETEKPETS